MGEIRVGKNFGGINYFNRIAKNPTYLAEVVNAVSKLPLEDSLDESKILAFEIENKIVHNNVVVYKRIVEDYAFYSNLINGVYNTISEVNPYCRDKIMRIVNKRYLDAKNYLVRDNTDMEEIESIRSNSDDIIAKVLRELQELLYNSTNLNEKIPIEDLEMALEIVVGDAFVNCKILENPNS